VKNPRRIEELSLLPKRSVPHLAHVRGSRRTSSVLMRVWDVQTQVRNDVGGSKFEARERGSGEGGAERKEGLSHSVT